MFHQNTVAWKYINNKILKCFYRYKLSCILLTFNRNILRWGLFVGQVLEKAFYMRLLKKCLVYMYVYMLSVYSVIYNLEYLTTTVCNLRGHKKIYGTGFLYVSD